MKRPIAALALIVGLVLSILSGCRSGSETKETQEEVVYNAKVAAFTSGIISNESAVQIRFAQGVPGMVPDQEAESGLIKFSPSIKGQLMWSDPQTLLFQPAERLPSGQTYQVKIDLPELFPDEDNKFEFTFQTIEQNFRLEPQGLEPDQADDLKVNTYLGRVHMADHIDDHLVEALLTAEQDGKALAIEWTHYPSEKSHLFKIRNVLRQELSGTLHLTFDGKAVGVAKKDTETIDIPSLNDFKVIDARVVMHPNQYVEVTFSDPLDARQNINGLISIGNLSQLKYSIENNRVKVYPSRRLSGAKTVIVSPGIKNILGYTVNSEERYDLIFETPKPAIQLIGQGTILPNSKGLLFPFKAVSLKSIEVRIIKIFENNVAHFLQVNQLDGSYQLKRAGRLIKKQNIRLDNDRSLDLTKWNTFSLNLADLIQPEQGAIYRIELKMRQADSFYPCENEESTEDIAESAQPSEDVSEADMAYWDTPSEYYNSYWDGYEDDDYYEWNERDDPCSPSYYRNKVVSRNILASDLGIIAKQGTDNEVVVAVTDIRTTFPISNVEVELYNYQNQVIGSIRTDEKGLARIPVAGKPYLLIAKNDQQRGYLRLDDGSSLSLSRFDVSGQVVQKGMKGFIYGERGVWRPGDTLFVSFILENKGETLPTDHPVVFELVNPHGQTITKQIQRLSPDNLYCFKTNTNSDAPTGMWLARVKIGGSTFEKGLRVETIKPNRLKIKLDFNTQRLTAGTPTQGKMEVKWLHGAIARNLKASVNVTLNQSHTSFPAYSGFTFDDPARRFDSEESTLFEGKLDENGKVSFDARIEVQDAAPGLLKASFMTRVFEESGDFSVDRVTMPYAPYPVFVGISTPKGDRRGMLLTDTTHTIQVVTVDADGQKMSLKDLDYYIYKVSWRWWWESSEDNLARYTGTRNNNLITSGKLSTTNGEGHFDFQIKYPEWGRYLIRVVDQKNGHATGKTVYVDWPGWAGRPSSSDPQAATMLSFSTNKEKYQVGEKATITYPASGKGRALISIENGNKVLKSFWDEPQKGMNEFTFEVTSEMTPNAYVHITLLQPHDQTVNNLPIRLYGVLPLMAEDPNSHLQPVIEMPEELRPEKEVTIKVSEAADKAMSYTLAVVDDGLLDLTRFQTPHPWGHFFAREALGVKTWDLYNQVIGAYGGKIEQIFSLGGDDEMGGNKGAKQANRFKPMVKFFGPFQLNKGKTNAHTFTVPRYVGSVRTMVIASADKAYGAAEKTTPVRNPLMVLATLPRVLGPQETVDLPVTVFAMKEGVKNVSVKIETNSLLTIEGESQQVLTFPQIGDQVATFRLKVNPAIGIGRVKVIASANGEEAVDEIELDIRNPNPKLTTFISQVIEPGKSNTLEYALPGMPGTNKATLEVSAIPPIDFGRRLKYLIQYPHGCVEQTTSSAFPQLFLADVVENGEALKAKTEENVKAAIKRLSGFIRPDGGLSYWPGSYESSDWGTTYAGHFMLEAEKKGYTLPVGFKRKWISFQKKQARQWSHQTNQNGHDLAHAYRLYTLALAGEAELSAMNRMRNLSSLSNQAKWRLAAAYALAGYIDVAEQLTQGVATSGLNQRGNSYTYGSVERDLAMVLETMSLLNKRNDAGPVVQQLSTALSGKQWMSTQTTAYCLLAISKFAGASTTSRDFSFEWSGKGQDGEKIHSQLPVFQTALKTDLLNGSLSVTNKSAGVIYARLVMEGIPAEDDQTAQTSNLQLTVEYSDMNGRAIDVTKLQQGTDFMAIVTVKNPGTLGHQENLALTQIFPSGWEIRNTRLEDIRSAHELDQPDYRDIRDDRVYSYFDLSTNKQKKLVVMLNAAYTGSYYLPAVSCEAMYNNTVSARQPGEWVEVIKAGL